MSLMNNLWVRYFCKEVGSDEFGNKYFTGKSKNYLGKYKRYVIYNGIDDGSKVPAGWHAWLHYLEDDLPENVEKHDWEIDHIQNLTGTNMAYSPKKTDKKSLETYSSWRP